jgi:drug/metabolite transporter (DMT)-like permease
MGNFFDGYTASAFRSVVVVLILLPFALTSHSFQPLRLKQNGRYIIGMVIASLFTWGPLYYAYLHAGISISTTINYASIVLSQFFFGWLFAGERFTKDKGLSALLGAIGLALVFSPSIKGIGWVALGAAFVSGLSVGANTVFAKKIKYNATQSTITLWTASVAANFIMVIVLSRPMPSFSWHIQWLYLLLFAAVSVVASWSLVRGVKLIDVGAAGVLGLLEIVFGVMFGVIFFHDKFGLLVCLGITVIIAAAAIPYLKDYNARRGTLD